MEIVRDPIPLKRLAELAEDLFGDKMINIRPSQANRSRGVEDPATRASVTAVVERLVL